MPYCNHFVEFQYLRSLMQLNNCLKKNWHKKKQRIYLFPSSHDQLNLVARLKKRWISSLWLCSRGQSWWPILVCCSGIERKWHKCSLFFFDQISVEKILSYQRSAKVNALTDFIWNLWAEICVRCHMRWYGTIYSYSIRNKFLFCFRIVKLQQNYSVSSLASCSFQQNNFHNINLHVYHGKSWALNHTQFPVLVVWNLQCEKFLRFLCFILVIFFSFFRLFINRYKIQWFWEELLVLL